MPSAGQGSLPLLDANSLDSLASTVEEAVLPPDVEPLPEEEERPAVALRIISAISRLSAST